jgi:MFS family permease
VGIFVAAQQTGAIFANIAWMPLGNRYGTRLVIRAGLGLAVVSLSMVAASTSAVTLALAFALSGGAMSAMEVGFGGYILELGTPDIQPVLFALEGTLLMPLHFMPFLGGWVADLCGYRVVVIFGIVLVTVALIAAAALCEPRRDDSVCGPCLVPEDTT